MWMADVISVKKRIEELRARNQAERQRLIQKMLSEKDTGKPTQKVKPEHHILYHCNTMDENGHSLRHGCSH